MSDRDHNGGPSYPIPVWNGILDHRAKIGSAVWVFLWCIDKITKEESGVGLILGGTVVTVGQIADELHDNERSIRRHLERLAEHGYVSMRRDPHGFIITVNNSLKFNIWRQSDRTKAPVRSDKSADVIGQKRRCNKEDTAVDSAEDTAENQTPPLPLPKIGRGVEINQQFHEYLKDDLSTGYVNNSHFQENAYEKYFRDAYLVEIRNGVAYLDSSNPTVLLEGIEKFQRRLRDTFRGVVVEVNTIRIAKSSALVDAS